VGWWVFWYFFAIRGKMIVLFAGGTNSVIVSLVLGTAELMMAAAHWTF
jgi:hypothetical protein